MWCLKKHQKYKTWCGRQFNYMVVKYMTMSLASHCMVHSMTGHSVVTCYNTLSNNASIDVIIRFYIIIVPFSNELVNSDICSTTHLWWYVILQHYIINVLANS